MNPYTRNSTIFVVATRCFNLTLSEQNLRGYIHRGMCTMLRDQTTGMFSVLLRHVMSTFIWSCFVCWQRVGPPNWSRSTGQFVNRLR
jgi:hypothetical protein